jgi:hypothetical protein
LFSNYCTPSAQLKHYWDSPVNGTDFGGTADYDMNSPAWDCPLDFGLSPPQQSRWATCDMNNNKPPQVQPSQSTLRHTIHPSQSTLRHAIPPSQSTLRNPPFAIPP